jgi:2-keto-4-pentenoate hydratase/2-oxohepta-3-ene-1,7-dioic acid hydratase in catechol pathway
MRQRKTHTSGDIIFPVEEVVSYLSKVMTRLPLNLVLTGAPPGIGMKVGNTIEIIIQDIEALRHTVAAGAKP